MRKQEERESREFAGAQLEHCRLDEVYDMVERALSFYRLVIEVARDVGPEAFRARTTTTLRLMLTHIAVCSILTHALPARPRAFLCVKHKQMKQYLDAVRLDPPSWETKAIASTDFKNINSGHFTHEALAIPPVVCEILNLYDEFIAPPAHDDSLFLRNTAGGPLGMFTESCKCVMRYWGDLIPNTNTGMF